jgi:hypothetical protein
MKRKAFAVALENQRWDLAAHVLIFAALRVNMRENGTHEKRHSKRKPKRP